MQFTKMHGLGNGYIFINGFVEDVVDPPSLARQVARVDTGIGSDGLILLLPPATADADVRMRIFNADGSEAEMCGNGIRCLARLAVESGVPGVGADAVPMRVETAAGVREVSFAPGSLDVVTVQMGPASFGPAAVGAERTHLREESDDAWSFFVNGVKMTGVLVGVGNPHAVFFVDAEAPELDLPVIGSAIERHPAFPARINVHFARILGPASIRMRTWERGSGETQACGTGACAVATAACATGRSDTVVTTHLPGGDLRIQWDRAVNEVFMTGPATEVCTGRLVPALAAARTDS